MIIPRSKKLCRKLRNLFRKVKGFCVKFSCKQLNRGIVGKDHYFGFTKSGVRRCIDGCRFTLKTYFLSERIK